MWMEAKKLLSTKLLLFYANFLIWQLNIFGKLLKYGRNSPNSSHSVRYIARKTIFNHKFDSNAEKTIFNPLTGSRFKRSLIFNEIE